MAATMERSKLGQSTRTTFFPDLLGFGKSRFGVLPVPYFTVRA